MIIYPDSSFLASYYIRDANTPKAQAYLDRAQAPLVFTPLHALEVRNAFKLGVFRRVFTPNEAAAAWSNLETDLRAGRLVKTPVKWPVAFRVAAHLSERHSSALGTRSLDILHVGAAKASRSKEFLSFDERQRSLAQLIGLIVAP